MNRANIQNIYPLLPNQEAFWSAHLHAATDPGCLQATYRLVGELDPDVLRQALQAVVENHPLLRSTIQSRPNKSAMMVVWKQASPSFEVHDFRHLSDEDKVSSVGAIKRRDTTEGLDLSKLTPHRFQLFQTEDHQFELTWTFHHIFIDGWSSAVVVRDVLERHDQILNAQTVKPSLVRYENFVAWRKTICSKTESRFWREQLDGYAGLAKRFPLAHAPGSTDRDSTKITRTLGARATNALGELAKTHGLTAGAIAAGLWTLTLSRFYGESDVAFGATVSGRSFPIDHAQDMVGLFSNVVPFRQRIEGSSSMASFLQSVRDKQFEIQAHEHASLAGCGKLSDL